MKISVKTEELLEHLQTLARVASARSAIQALAGVQIEASEKAIELRATDQELSLRVPLEGNVAQGGTVVLPARLLLDVVRQLPGDTVSLEYRGKEQDVEIVGGTAQLIGNIIERALLAPNQPLAAAFTLWPMLIMVAYLAVMGRAGAFKNL